MYICNSIYISIYLCRWLKSFHQPPPDLLPVSLEVSTFFVALCSLARACSLSLFLLSSHPPILSSSPLRFSFSSSLPHSRFVSLRLSLSPSLTPSFTSSLPHPLTPFLLFSLSPILPPILAPSLAPLLPCSLPPSLPLALCPYPPSASRIFYHHLCANPPLTRSVLSLPHTPQVRPCHRDAAGKWVVPGVLVTVVIQDLGRAPSFCSFSNPNVGAPPPVSLARALSTCGLLPGARVCLLVLHVTLSVYTHVFILSTHVRMCACAY